MANLVKVANIVKTLAYRLAGKHNKKACLTHTLANVTYQTSLFESMIMQKQTRSLKDKTSITNLLSVSEGNFLLCDSNVCWRGPFDQWGLTLDSILASIKGWPTFL